MSLRGVLIRGVVVVVVAIAALIGGAGIFVIDKTIRHEAQAQVNHDLNMVRGIYDEQLKSLAEEIEESARGLSLSRDDLEEMVREVRQDIGLSVLNICDKDGVPIAGGYPDAELRVPLGTDPVLREALEGKLVYGTVKHEAMRLMLEGDTVLQESMSIPLFGESKEKSLDSALFWWVGYPVIGADGCVEAVVYGGRGLNSNFELVDNLQKLVFGTKERGGKALGTVTVFLDGFRVAANVVGADGRRPVGTIVSDGVRERVLKQGKVWIGRAWVEDELYLIGFDPLRDPDGIVVGMLCAGVLEAPYVELKQGLIRRFVVVLVVISVVAAVVGLLVVSRMTKPLKQLSEAVSEMGKAEREHPVPDLARYSEIREIAEDFRRIQGLIVEREKQLAEQRVEFSETNDKLEEAERNYMEVVGFVTQELKSSLAAIQGVTNEIFEAASGDVDEGMKQPLEGIRRSCEEIEEIVRDYLDLSRIERGGLKAQKSKFDFRAEVVDPCVTRTRRLFESRGISLDVECPGDFMVFADPELMGIALRNYLSDAAKYGREGGRAKLEVSEENDMVTVSVWNEGEGFTEEEGQDIFKKFSKVKREDARAIRDSGLGLFICAKILEQHYGKVSAESDAGSWARLMFTFPNPKQPRAS